jgi:hypothetical protein
VELVDSERIERLVVAGERNVALLRNALPPSMAEHIVGEIAGSRDGAGHVLVRRATEVLSRAEGQRHAEEVVTVLVTAAKGGKAAAGVDATLDAVTRGAVHRLYLLRDFRESGRVCVSCGDLGRGSHELCQLCGKPTRQVDLAEAMVHRVIVARWIGGRRPGSYGAQWSRWSGGAVAFSPVTSRPRELEEHETKWREGVTCRAYSGVDEERMS